MLRRKIRGWGEEEERSKEEARGPDGACDERRERLFVSHKAPLKFEQLSFRSLSLLLLKKGGTVQR